MLEEINRIITDYFKNPNDAARWFKQPNFLLNGYSPKELVKQGELEKLLAFVKKCYD